MGDSFPPQDVMMSEGQSPPPIPTEELKYGGFTRFEIELEFVQSLASPMYLNHLASRKYLENPAFIAYLKYLQYFSHPPYLKYLTYPGPTLKNLELLQQEKFRSDILSPDTVARLVDEGGKQGWSGRIRNDPWKGKVLGVKESQEINKYTVITFGIGLV